MIKRVMRVVETESSSRLSREVFRLCGQLAISREQGRGGGVLSRRIRIRGFKGVRLTERERKWRRKEGIGLLYRLLWTSLFSVGPGNRDPGRRIQSSIQSNSFEYRLAKIQ